jgi:hypothetical protein
VRERARGGREERGSTFYRERGGEGETSGWNGRPSMAINAIEGERVVVGGREVGRRFPVQGRRTGAVRRARS